MLMTVQSVSIDFAVRFPFMGPCRTPLLTSHMSLYGIISLH